MRILNAQEIDQVAGGADCPWWVPCWPVKAFVYFVEKTRAQAHINGQDLI